MIMIEYTVRVFDSGTKLWCLNGNLHREDGPAIEWGNGDKSWWLNGEKHREDGPSVINYGLRNKKENETSLVHKLFDNVDE